MAKEWFGVAWLQDAPIHASHTKRVLISEDPKLRKSENCKEDDCRDVCVVRATTTEYDASY